MGYMLPLRFIRVSQKRSDNGQFDVAICATRIVAMMSTETFQARRTIKEEKKSGTLINAAGREAVKTAIFLDNGSVVASPLTVNRLLTAIEKSNLKEPDISRSDKQKRIKVYDISDEEPNPEIDIDMPEITIDNQEYDEIGEFENVDFINEDAERDTNDIC